MLKAKRFCRYAHAKRKLTHANVFLSKQAAECTSLPHPHAMQSRRGGIVGCTENDAKTQSKERNTSGRTDDDEMSKRLHARASIHTRTHIHM